MRFFALLVLVAVLLLLPACGRENSTSTQFAGTAPRTETGPAEATKTMGKNESVEALSRQTQPVSLKEADSANMASQAFDRKIIRNANLTLEVSGVSNSQQKLMSIAEAHQGFVVTSESTVRNPQDQKPETTVNLVVRVPAAQFGSAMDAIRAVGVRVIQEKITGQDVTEEFMDLDARIKNQKALEIQFIEIMKRAGGVDDALSVQRELADVRTQIEKLEGRKRYLENQSSLSTINVTLQPPALAIVNATGFWYSVKTAFSDGLDVALGIILFLIRAVIALTPVLILIVLPLALLVRFGLKFGRRRKQALATAEAVSQ
jgi:hypothetical protein